MTPAFLDLLRQHVSAEAYRQLAPDDLWSKFRDALDEMAFRVLLERFGSRVYQRCRAILGDDDLAEEAFQDTFRDLVRKRGKIPTYRSAAAWAYQTGTNHAKHLRRRRWLQRRRERHGSPVDKTTAVPIGADNAEELARMLADLPDRYRRPLELVYWDGLTHAEAAKVLGWSKGTVDSYVARGLKRLRSQAAKLGLPAAVVGIEAALARPAAAVSESVLENLLGRVWPEGGPVVAVAQWWSPGWMKAVVALTTVGAAVGMWLGPAEQPRPVPAPRWPPSTAAEPVETLQAKNLRILHAQVIPRVLELANKMIPLQPPGNRWRTEGVRAYGSKVRFSLRPSEPVADRGFQIDVEYCTHQRRLWAWAFGGGKWRAVDPDDPVKLTVPFLLRRPIQVSVPGTRELYTDGRRAFDRLPPDDRAEEALVRWAFGPGGWTGDEFTLTASATWAGVAGNGRDLFASSGLELFVRRGAGGVWRYWGRQLGAKPIAADATHLYGWDFKSIVAQRIDAPAAAPVTVCDAPPGEVRSIAVAGGTLFVSTQVPGEYWHRPLAAQVAGWTRATLSTSPLSLAAAGGHLYAADDKTVFRLHDGDPVRVVAVPTPAPVLAVWGDRLLAVSRGPGPVHARPLSTGPDLGWEVIGRVHDPEGP